MNRSLRCTRVSPDDYDHYCTFIEFNWSCLLCLFDVLPPDNVCDSSIVQEVINFHMKLYSYLLNA